MQVLEPQARGAGSGHSRPLVGQLPHKVQADPSRAVPATSAKWVTRPGWGHVGRSRVQEAGAVQHSGFTVRRRRSVRPSAQVGVFLH